MAEESLRHGFTWGDLGAGGGRGGQMRASPFGKEGYGIITVFSVLMRERASISAVSEYHHRNFSCCSGRDLFLDLFRG